MVVFLIFLFSTIASCGAWSDNRVRSFQDGFMFGVSSSAYQIEGAWNIDGKGESIWDHFTHNHPEHIVTGVTGDDAAKSYYFYKRDVQLLRELGVDHYRFSISWSRVLPDGLSNKVNEKGLEYYDKLIDELIKYKIEPVITLNHFDLPQSLQDFGGWTHPLSQYWFEDYADIIFNRYASKVKFWITVNQPDFVCHHGYGGSKEAPGLNSAGIGEYLCTKYVLLAHARAYRLYEKKYKKKHKGSVGISLCMNWYDAIDKDEVNVQAVEEYREFTIGMYVHPIWSKNGDFPKIVKDIIAKKSKKQGFVRSRLPELTSEEIKLLRGSADFLGVNHYTTYLVKRSNNTFPQPSFDDDVRIELSQGEQWKKSATTSWLASAPYGIYRVLIYLNLNYDYPKVFITENGWATDLGLQDESRVEYIKSYMRALLFALEDGTDCVGYSYWSLMDNVEWGFGTKERFGLYQVDFISEERPATARLSAHVYKHIIEVRNVEDDWSPTNFTMSVSDRRLRKKKIIKSEL